VVHLWCISGVDVHHSAIVPVSFQGLRVLVAVAFTDTPTNHIKSLAIRSTGHLFFIAMSGGSFHFYNSNPNGTFVVPFTPIHPATFCTNGPIRLHLSSNP
jgi:hypothetical protein